MKRHLLFFFGIFFSICLLHIEYAHANRFLFSEKLLGEEFLILKGVKNHSTTEEVVPSCSSPSNISIHNVTIESAEIRFALEEDIQMVRFIYKSATATEWDSIDKYIEYPFEDTSYVLNNLIPKTSYKIFLKTFCEYTIESSPSAELSFSTKCNPTSFANWIEDFGDKNSIFPPSLCWERKLLAFTPQAIMYDSSMTFSNYWQKGIDTALSEFNIAASIPINEKSSNSWLISPPFELSSYANNFLEFDVKLVHNQYKKVYAPPYLNATDKFVVLISLDNGNSWEPSNATIWSNDIDATYPYHHLNNQYKTIQIPLPETTGIVRIAFFIQSKTSSIGTVAVDYDYLYIDNVSITDRIKPTDLRIKDISLTSATILWEYETLSSENFTVEYKADTSTEWIPDLCSATEYTFENLLPNTKYLVRIKTNYNDNVYSSYSAIKTFKTPCSTSSLPIFEDFNNLTSSASNNAPPCWSFLQEGNSLAYISYSTEEATNYYYLFNKTTSPAQKTALISPYISQPINQVRVRFMAKSIKDSTYLKIGTMSNLSDTSTFVLYKTIHFSKVNSWERHIISFDSNPNSNGNHIVLMHGQAATSRAIYLDDIAIEEIPFCKEVDTITIVEVSSTSSIIKWNTVEDVPNYDVQYRFHSNDSIGPWSNIITVNTNSYSITQLSPVSSYDVRVRCKCDITDTGIWSLPISFTTLCMPIEVPFVEDFSTLTAFSQTSKCWDSYTGILSTNGERITLTENGAWKQKGFANMYHAPKAASINIKNKTSGWLVTPVMDLGEAGNAILEFDLALVKNSDRDTSRSPTAADKNGEDDKFVILVSTDGFWSIDNTVAIWDNTPSSYRRYNSITSSPGGERIVIPLTGITGPIRIAFYGESTISNANNDLFIDELLVYRPTCAKVDSIQQTIISTTVIAKWFAPEEQNEWKITCTETNASTSTSHIVNTPEYTFENLKRGSTYRISVQNICDKGDTSNAAFARWFIIPQCDLVNNITVNQECATSAIVTWHAPEEQTEWKVSYYTKGQDTLFTVAKNNSTDTLLNLLPNVEYQLLVQPICGEGDTGNYASTSFTSIACEPINDFLIVQDNDSIFISWISNVCFGKWQILLTSEKNVVQKDTTIYTYPVFGVGLKLPTEFNNYNISVRNYCNNEYYSEWTTKNNSITTSENTFSPAILLAPNPAKDYTMLHIENVIGDIQINMLSITGRILYHEKTICNYSLKKKIPLHNLPKGTYLIQITHKNWIRIEKLMVW